VRNGKHTAGCEQFKCIWKLISFRRSSILGQSGGSQITVRRMRPLSGHHHRHHFRLILSCQSQLNAHEVKKERLKSHIITKLIATFIQTTNQEVCH